ncbi:MlaD family protein [Mycobacterium intracellulare]|uniref:Mce family protein n=1 Tax=Mycobacterium intracellulare subsp. chimaera TaxID=222805 RepID=A0A7U5RY21_MYCIT|nr:MlaD family protein [Mycobacterium intracellulare]ASL17544.1 mce family protein [Mycobacterium intracellulare subsp. chimaera]MDM3929479.1 MlaD family protein [Mycobacterium intracellulare subsp. chimaera]
MQSVRAFRNPVTWGAGAILLVAVVSLVLAYVYFHPPGQSKRVTFYTNDAASIRVGDEVRMAGIRVGKVEKMELEAQQVRVTARVKNDAFVGDQSQIDVRMLTVVGGYYVNLVSIGNTPIGDTAIPLTRVTMPYSLIRTLTDTTKITENVNAKPLNDSLNQLQQGLTGTNVEVVSAVVDAGNAIMSTVDRQRGQVTDILNMSDEYIRALSAYRDKFDQLVRKVSILTQTLVLYSGGMKNTIQGIATVLAQLGTVGEFYEAHRVEFIEKVQDYLHRGRLFVERNGLTIRVLRRVQNLFDRILNAQNAAPALLATDICIPIPGESC